jgi:COP9 signalosome complex subunit 2
MTQLVDAYQSNNLHQFEEILRKNHEAFSDPFIAENIDEVTQHIRSRAMLQLVKPYVRFRLEWAAKELGVSEEVALDTLSVLMISGKFGAKVDRATNIVAVTENDSPERWDALREWDQSLNALWAHTFVKRDGRPPPERKPRARGRGGHFR